MSTATNGQPTATVEEVAAHGQALEQLAEDIRRHHRQVERHASAMVREAVAAGETLLQAKAQLSHGEFGPFVAYCGVSARSARVYMRLARNSADAAVLKATSIRAALEAIAGPSRQRPKPPSFGPPCPPSMAGRPGWQLERWLEAMEAQGRDRAELRRLFRPDGRPKKARSRNVP